MSEWKENRKSYYRLYVDESGNSDLESSDNPNHRFLSLTGIIIALEYVDRVMFPGLEKLKAKYFLSHPDDPIILHRAELVNKKPPFKVLKDPDTETSFNIALLDLLEKWEYVIITVLIDKREHKEKYSTWKYDPYHYCLAVLLERYQMFLETHMKLGDTMAESRGGKEDMRLKDSYKRLYENGTEYVKAERFQRFFTSSQLKIKNKSNNIAGLQIADILAHPSRREMLKEDDIPVPNTDKEVFGDKIIKILQKKYYASREGIIKGFGKKKLP